MLARQEPFEHMQREIMRAEIKRHADRAAGQLLRRVDAAKSGRTTMRAVGNDAAPADLAAPTSGCPATRQ